MLKNRLAAGAALALLGAGAASAQDAPGTIQGLENFSLPAAQPTPAPSPAPASSPSAVPTPTAPAIVLPTLTPAPRATPTRTPTPAPTARATPRAAATPTPNREPRAAPVPAPTLAPEPASQGTPGTPPPLPLPPTPEPTPAPTASVAEPVGLPIWAIPAALVALAVLIGGITALRRRRAAAAAAAQHVAIGTPAAPPVPIRQPRGPAARPARPAPVTPSAPAAALPAPAAGPSFLTPPPRDAVDRAMLSLDAPTVRRAGINLVTATANVAITVRNDGPALARGVRVDIRLTSAQPGQDTAVAALFGEAADRPAQPPAAPPFDLAPGETRLIRTLATMPRDSITVLQAGDRPMFVPVIAVRATYVAAEGVSAHVTTAHAIGIERADSPKLAPIWLDRPPRMYDDIGVRPHSLAREG